MKVLALPGPWPCLGRAAQGWAQAFVAQLRPHLEAVEVGRWPQEGEVGALAAPVLPARAFLAPIRLVLDCRPWPASWLERPLAPRRRAWVDLQLALADHILCQGPAQRDHLIGALFALGLVPPQTYRRDPCLARLVIATDHGLQALVAALRCPPPTPRWHRLPLVARKWALGLPHTALG